MDNNKVSKNYLGNKAFLNNHITGFLCSRQISASSVLRSYNWAIEQSKAGTCVIGGFHSKIERDVLNFLLKGNQPLIIVLARYFYKRMHPAITERLEKGNILIISPFDETVKRTSKESCFIRNKLIVELADELVVGFKSPHGQLSRLLAETSKPITYL